MTGGPRHSVRRPLNIDASFNPLTLAHIALADTVDQLIPLF